MAVDRKYSVTSVETKLYLQMKSCFGGMTEVGLIDIFTSAFIFMTHRGKSALMGDKQKHNG